ncbi:MAG: HlyC/CorC family transporter [Polyangiaceae bacterium]|nr:HlyC/CorC family transporter [Polyangiaceae bacterium]
MALVIANGLLAGAEIALVSVRRTRLDMLVSEGRRNARAVARLRQEPERFLATIQVGITVIGAAAGAYGGSSIARDLEPLLQPVAGEHADGIAFVLVVGGISFLSLVLGELVPKSLALRIAETYALWAARPVLALSWLSRPIVWILTKSSNVILRLFGDKTSFTEARLSPGEIQQIVDEAADAGAVPHEVGKIASRAIDFGEMTVAPFMVPRHRVVGLKKDASKEEIKRLVLEQGRARMPVYEGSLDNVVGYVTLRDLMALLLDGQLLVLGDALRKPLLVPESMLAVDLLDTMRREHVHLAIVVDEVGAMSGLATLEDLVEELVGSIASEHDWSAVDFRLEDDGTVAARGEAGVHALNRELDLGLPEGERFTTVAGLTLELAGRIPSQGETFETDTGAIIEVIEVDTRRILAVKISKSTPPPAAEAT